MAESKIVLLPEWVGTIKQTLSQDDAAKVIQAIIYYSLYDEKIEIGDALKPVAAPYFDQIDKILKKYPNGGGRRDKYDNDAIAKLAAQGKSVKEICEELGVEYSRGIVRKAIKKEEPSGLKLKKRVVGMTPVQCFDVWSHPFI